MPPQYETRVRNNVMAKYLMEKGYRVKIFSASTLHNTNINLIEDKKKLFIEKNYEGLEFVHIRTSNYTGNGLSRLINMLQFPLRLLKVAKKINKKPDIIICDLMSIFAWSPYLVAKKFKSKFILEVRDLWPESIVAYKGISRKNPIIKLLFKLEKWIYKNADKIIFTMEGGKDYIIDKGWDKNSGGPIDLDKVYHINNGADLKEFEFNKRNYILDDEDLKDDSFYKIVYTGSLRQANDSVWRLIEVADLFKKEEHFDIKFLIYGDGGERKKIEEYCKENKLDNVFIKGHVGKKYVPYILSRCDLNVLNCSSWSVLEYGGSQNKLFEYLASGHPIISGENSKYSIISNYNCGISRNFEDIRSLGEAILELKNLDSNSKKIMSENILTVAKNYDYAYLTQKLIEIIEG